MHARDAKTHGDTYGEASSANGQQHPNAGSRQHDIGVAGHAWQGHRQNHPCVDLSLQTAQYEACCSQQH